MHHFTSGLILLAVLSYTKEECIYSNGNFLCAKMLMEDVVYELYDKVPLNQTAKSIQLFDAKYDIIQHFLYPAQEKLATSMSQIKIVSCGVEIVENEAFTAFSDLEELDLSNNKITDIFFIKFLPTSLKKLSLRSNDVEEVHNVFSNLKELKYVDFSSCKIKNSFDFAVFKDVKLDFVNVSNNNINTSVSTSTDENVYCVDLSNNILVTYAYFPFDCFDVSYTSLKKIYYHSVYTDPNIFAFINKSIHRGNDDIGLEARNANNKLVTIEVNYLDISSANYDFKDLQNLVDVKVLKELILKNSTIPKLKKSIFDLKRLLYDDSNDVKLDLSFCSITDIDRLYFSDYNLGILNLSNNNIAKLKNYVFSNSWITELDLSNSNIEEIENSAFYKLNCDNLNLSGNKLTYFKFKPGKNFMQKINLSFNKLIKIDDESFGVLKSIEFLDLSNNLLTVIDKYFFGNLQNIGFLNLRNNKLVHVEGIYSYSLKINSLSLTYHEDLSTKIFGNINNYIRFLTIFDMNTNELKNNYFMGLHSLQEIQFKNSNILSVASNSLNGLFSLEQLDSQNLFKHVTALRRQMFKNMKSLVELDLSSLSIEVIEDESFFGLTRLNNLSLKNNKLNTLSNKAFHGVYNLHSLYLSKNNLTTIPLGIFTNLENLEILDLSENSIHQLVTGVFSNLHNLKTLLLSYNAIETLNANILFPLSNLLDLYLDGNYLITVDYESVLTDLPVLNYIGLTDNEWNCGFLHSMLQSLKNKEVNYYPILYSNYSVTNINGVACTDLCNNDNYCKPTRSSA